MNLKPLSLFSIPCAVTLFLVAACSAGGPPALSSAKPAAPAAAPTKAAAAPTTIRASVRRGQQIFPIIVIEDLGLDKKYGFVLDKKEYATPEAASMAVRNKEIDVGFDGWTEAVKFRAQGLKIMNVYPLSIFVNAVVTKVDSPLKGLEDVKGKSLGTFYHPGSITSGLVRSIGLKYYGFDPYAETKLQQGARPLLMGLLDKGELDAIYLSEPELAMMTASGKYKAIMTVKEIYATKAKTEVPFQLAVEFNEEWADKNLEAAKGYVAAIQEAVRYIKSNPDVWKKLADEVQISDPKAVELLRQSVGDGYVARPWDDKYVAQQVEFAKELRKILGPDFLPEGDYSTVFTNKYSPAN